MSPAAKSTPELPMEEAKSRVAKLQAVLEQHKLDYYIIGTADEHLSEWTHTADARREYISGFNGSAGTAIIGRPGVNDDKTSTSPAAWLFVDNRYWVQAEQQTSTKVWNVVRVHPKDSPQITSPWEWCQENVKAGARIGIDPKLVSFKSSQDIAEKLKSASITLVPISENLVDKVRPAPAYSLSKVEDHPLDYAGKSTTEKLKEIRKDLFGEPGCPKEDDKAGGVYLLTVLPAIAWFLNARCHGDIPNVPAFRSYLALTLTTCALFIDDRKVTPEIKQKLQADDIEIRPYGIDQVKRWVLEHRVRVREEQGEKALDVQGRVLIPSETSWGMVEAIGQEHVKTVSECPVDKAKAVKNPVEIEGFRRAYLRDGAATARWIAWLEEEIKDNNQSISEWEASEKMTWFRTFEENYKGMAYDNISASGPNGALPHYAPVKGQDRIIDRETTFVIDAGGQYMDGTVDTTRTLHFGTPTADQKRAYTRVLQGHIAIETTPFPTGTKGDKLDPLARQFLWKEGLNFGHGVGHGIGAYLSVHEIPPGIGWATTIRPGHVVSNEPGFYLEGEWGIRIESVVVCKEIKTRYNYDKSPWLGWERITRVPIQTDLVDYELMTQDEKTWLKEHNEQCKREVMPLLNRPGDEKARQWLERQ